MDVLFLNFVAVLNDDVKVIEVDIGPLEPEVISMKQEHISLMKLIVDGSVRLLNYRLAILCLNNGVLHIHFPIVLHIGSDWLVLATRDLREQLSLLFIGIL